MIQKDELVYKCYYFVYWYNNMFLKDLGIRRAEVVEFGVLEFLEMGSFGGVFWRFS